MNTFLSSTLASPEYTDLTLCFFFCHSEQCMRYLVRAVVVIVAVVVVININWKDSLPNLINIYFLDAVTGLSTFHTLSNRILPTTLGGNIKFISSKGILRFEKLINLLGVTQLVSDETPRFESR